MNMLQTKRQNRLNNNNMIQIIMLLQNGQKKQFCITIQKVLFEYRRPNKMKMEQVNKQKCTKHPESFVSLINLASISQFPVLACPNCLDEQDYQLKKLYISTNRFLQIQKSFKEINNTDVVKQLWELNYMQAKVNQLFQNAKRQVASKSHDKVLAAQFKIQMVEEDTLEKQCRKQVLSLNNQYLDLEQWMKKKKNPDEIDNLVRQKYFKQNNGITQLLKVSEQVTRNFKFRVDRNKSIDAQINRFKQLGNEFTFGEFTDNEKRLIVYYNQKFVEQNNSKYEKALIQYDDIHWFDCSFLNRYFKQASIYAEKLNFINLQPALAKQIQQISEKIRSYHWIKLKAISFINKFQDSDIKYIFQIVSPGNLKKLYFCQMRQLQQLQGEMIMAQNQQDAQNIPEIQIKKNISFQIFQQYQQKLKNLECLVIERIQLKCNIVENILNSCQSLKQLILSKNNLNLDSYVLLGACLQQKKLPYLLMLTVSQNNMGTQETKSLLIDKNAFSQLQYLNLYGNKIDDISLEVILESNLQKLKTLILNKNQLRAPKSLLCTHLKQLRVLSLNNNNLQTTYALRLVSKKWKNQLEIYLSKNRIARQTFANVVRYKNNIRVEYEQSKRLSQNYTQNFISEKVVRLQEQNQIRFVIQNAHIYQNRYLKSVKETFNQLDLLYAQNPYLTARLCQFLLSSPPSADLLQKSQQIQQQLKQTAAQEQNIFSIVMLGYLQLFSQQENQKSLIFMRDSSIKSQICMKILTNQFLCELVKFQQTIKLNQLDQEQIFQNADLVYKLKQFYIQRASKEYNIQEQGVVIHKIRKIQDKLQIQWSTDQQDSVMKINQTQNKLKVKRFFQNFVLAIKDFEQAQITQYGQESKIQFLGKWPCFMPIRCKKVGLSVSGKFDNQNNSWFSCQNKQLEWPIAYHGAISISGYQNMIQHFKIAGLSEGTAILGGGKQIYQSINPINIPSQSIGSGYYFYPQIQTVLSNLSGNGVKIQDNSYFIILQCRLNPKKIKICPNDLYWVINSTIDIRPSSIIIIKKQNVENYPTIEQAYAQQKFTWQAYKDRINS